MKIMPVRIALAAVFALAVTAGAGAQSSLGGAGSVPPPRAAAPSAPQATAPAAPRRATRPAQASAPRPAQSNPTRANPTRANRPIATPRPPQTAAQRQAAQQRRAAAAAAAAATAAAAAPAQAAPPAPPEPQAPIGSVTGLPMPRFAALRSNDVNLRVGPDRRFPVEWRYQRSDLPVQIIREHDQWRRIRDPDGTEGWLAASNLQPGRRTFIVRGEPNGEVPLRRRAEEASGPVARLRPGVIGRIRGCDAGSEWCEVQVQDRRGFIKRSEIFGVLPDEEIK